MEITCRQDPYLYDRLQDYVSRVQATQGEKLFYSEATMRKEAGRLGMECHDLRRIYANTQQTGVKSGDACGTGRQRGAAQHAACKIFYDKKISV